MSSQEEVCDLMAENGNLRAEIGRLLAICRTIATGLRGEYASRIDMAKIAETASQQTAPETKR